MNRLLAQLSPGAQETFHRKSSGAQPSENAELAAKPPPGRQPAPKLRGLEKPGTRRERRELVGQPLSAADRAQRRAKALDREHAREMAVRDRVLGKIRAVWASQGQEDVTDYDLRVIPVRVWRECWRIVGDVSGRAALYARARCRVRAFVGAFNRAMHRADGTIYSLAGTSQANQRARRIAAAWYALVQLSERTARKGAFNAIVKGISQGAFMALLRDPHEPTAKATPHRNTLFGNHRPGAAADSGEVGYFIVLREAGMYYAQQLPTRTAEERAKLWACERFGPSGRATNRYWLVTTEAVESITDDELRAAVLDLQEAARRPSFRVVPRSAAPPTS